MTTMSNPTVVPASKTNGLRTVGFTAISPGQSYFKPEDVLPANVLALTSFSGPILSPAPRVFSRSAGTSEARPSGL